MAGQQAALVPGPRMPTLVRLFVILVVLEVLVGAAMLALTIFVDPGEKDITIKIPARELVPPSAPIDVNNLPAPVNIAPKDESSSSSSAAQDDSTDDSAVKTIDAPGEE
jgi:hypothetical protein